MEPSEILKEQVIKVLDDLPPQQVAQVLDFALFVRERHVGGSPAESSSQQAPTADAWELLKSLQGSVDGPADWSIEHDHYLYGTPKRNADPKDE
jgi:hypothetical protein